MNPVVQEQQKVRREVWECAVSWAWLLSFVEEKKDEIRNLSTQDVVTKIVIPTTRNKKCRYVDVIPDSCVSRPNYFASHVWSAPFLDLVASLRGFIGENLTEDVFVWIDIFAVNQHKDSGTQESDLKDLHKAVKESQKSIICIDTNAKLLTRIWCLFEIWHTFLLDVRRLVVVAQNTNTDKLQDIFRDCDVELAEATVIADRGRILADIVKEMSYQEMNKNIKAAIVESAKIEVQKATELHGPENTRLIAPLTKYGDMLYYIGRNEEAESNYKQALAISEKVWGPDHSETVKLLITLGDFFQCKENVTMKNFLPEEAESFYRRAIAIKEKIFSPERPDTAKALFDIGEIYLRALKFKEAETYYRQYLNIIEKELGPEHLETAKALCEIGYTLNIQSQYYPVLSSSPLFL